MKLPRPDEVRAAGDVYRADMDTVGRFLSECGEFSGSLTVGSLEFYSEYRRWAEIRGERPMSHKSFSSRMKDRKGVVSEHRDCGTVFVGVGLRKAPAKADGDES
jgi:putative DNA primase/helicase